MKKHLGTMGAFWLGGSLAYFANTSYLKWEFYVIAVPVLILFTLDKKLNKNER